ncbi:hypothetical protein pqer_cds_722 [Pandoravirus quercus]|uniref:Uncharacterized protein n=2 Tax=Pandoravirus TaxID=2060084 RepID=A0A2U7U9N5_9VIRU|nr:hypothetical protein pqer_cds_722 [Pandoravirus quercus]AVK75144.1 hypothetical protein pqer_cds_722 [Pandoravirus quercus]QBZ81309.1 hypothetical protein pclt_cds_722 [Pandoravirus celtis]
MRRSTLLLAQRPIAHAIPSSLLIQPARRLATCAATTGRPSTFLARAGRFYAGISCVGAVAWGGILFATEWEWAGRHVHTTHGRLYAASTEFAKYSLLAVAFGVVWPLAPLIFNDLAAHLDARETNRRAAQKAKEAELWNAGYEHAKAHAHREKQERKRQKASETHHQAALPLVASTEPSTLPTPTGSSDPTRPMSSSVFVGETATAQPPASAVGPDKRQETTVHPTCAWCLCAH